MFQMKKQNIKSKKYMKITGEEKNIRVPKVAFRVFHKLKNEIQNCIVRFCFCLNMKNEIQIFRYHFHA